YYFLVIIVTIVPYDTNRELPGAYACLSKNTIPAISAEDTEYLHVAIAAANGHDGIAVNGPIKRSTSAKSAKTYYSNMSQESFGGGLKGKRGSIMQIDLMDDISETEKSSSSVGDSTLNSSHIHHSHHTNTANGSQRGGGYMSDDDKSRRSAEIRQAKRDGWWWE
ncbi:hypothetical protein BGZ58_000171, partial [Dissophora ornata]